jgi:hypothetical protein
MYLKRDVKRRLPGSALTVAILLALLSAEAPLSSTGLLRLTAA